MQKAFFIFLILMLPALSQAQFSGIANRAKAKVANRVNRKIDQAIDKGLDELEGNNASGAPASAPAPKKTNSGGEQPQSKAVAEEAPAEKKVTAYSRFDFVPGERILYAEDFGQDAVGELPLTWNASGKGEVMTLEGKPGKWLRLFQGNNYLTGNTKTFGENYTIEFDLLYFFQPKKTGYLLPGLEFGIFSSGKLETTDNSLLKNQESVNALNVQLHVSGNTSATLHSYKEGKPTFNSDRLPLHDYDKQFNTVLHYAIQVQKQRFRLWINDTKVFDIPRAVNTGDTLNQIFFHLEGSNYKDEEIGAFLTNLKVATGLPDTRHKLMEEGKFSTTGILFDFQSAVIKPESWGVIREIAGVLKESAGAKIKIIGHTSSDGDDAANMELSKQRAAAVKDLLVKEFGIDAARLSTEGKGETQPIADNKTKEGKTQNRRVEFVKE